MLKIGIIILATNSYFALGIRFIKKFMYHYKGNAHIKFYFFSNHCPKSFLQDEIDVEFFNVCHKSWVDATNDKFKSIISLDNCDRDYLYYFDADTGVTKNFTEDWFLGDLVGGEHYGNKLWLKDGAGLDKNPASKAYVPQDSPLPFTYYYGAFFGGKKDKVLDFCKTLLDWQQEDKKINYEPVVNDESYINAYFHYNQPLTVSNDKFAFDISDKGGIEEMRNVDNSVDDVKAIMLLNKNNTYDIIDRKIVLIPDVFI